MFSPEGILTSVVFVRLAVTAGIVVVAWLCGDAARRLIARIGNLRKVDASLIYLFGQIARGAILALAGIIVLGTLGIDVRPWWPASVWSVWPSAWP